MLPIIKAVAAISARWLSLCVGRSGHEPGAAGAERQQSHPQHPVAVSAEDRLLGRLVGACHTCVARDPSVAEPAPLAGCGQVRLQRIPHYTGLAALLRQRLREHLQRRHNVP